MEEMNNKIEKIKITGLKKFKEYVLEFKEGINILIGENESGKSTILEAINIVLNQKYNNYDKYIIEDLLNRDNVKLFEESKKYEDLPKISIEIFLKLQNNPNNSIYFGVNHSENLSGAMAEDNFKYGIIFECCFDEDFKPSLITSIQEGKIPYDFYKMVWRTFKNEPYKVQKKPLKVLNIDNSISSANSAYDYYNKNLYLDEFEPNDRLTHKSIFREKLKDSFESLNIKNISKDRKFGLSQKKLIMENLLTILEKDISIENMGRGKENIIKTETALNKDSNKSDIILIEEPESHLSHLNLRYVIELINNSTDNSKQIIITTHNNLIVKQSDISSLIIIGDEKPKSISNLNNDIKYFFEKSDDFNLLQFLLSNKCILVEGRTEYQLINKKYSKLIGDSSATLDGDKIDVISCYGKVYKYYVEVAKGLNKKVCIITDNDGSDIAIQDAKEVNDEHNNIRVFMDSDSTNWTFEVCLYNLNKQKLESLIEVQKGSEYKFNKVSYKDKPVLGYMLNHKADTAYKLFNEESEDELLYPQYIKDALKWIKE